MPARMSDSNKDSAQIFIPLSVYADQDGDLGRRVAEIFDTARYPDRIFLGIAKQMGPDEDPEADISTDRAAQIRVTRIDTNHLPSCGYIRTQALRMMEREAFVFSFPANHRLVEDWDSRLLDMIEQCGDDRAILTSGITQDGAPSRPVFCRFDESTRLPLLEDRPVGRESQQTGAALRSAFCRATFLFAPAQALRDVPQDPHICQTEQDISLSVRLWTWGWNIFAARECPTVPMPASCSSAGDVASELSAALSRKRLRHMLGIASSDEREPLRDLEKFGLGSNRSIAEFERFAGLHFASQVAEPRARDGRVEPVESPSPAAAPNAGLHVVVSPVRSLDLRKLRHSSTSIQESSLSAATPDLSGLDRLPRKILENDQVLVFDDFLPELIYDEVYRWAIYADYQHVNMGERISRAWRPHDGFPMRSLDHCVFEDQPRHDGDKPAWEYPTKTAFDLIAERIALIAPDAEKLIGRRGPDWSAFAMHSYIYPARSGMSLHHDDQAKKSGAFTYFMAPQWDVHWGGLLVVLDPRTALGNDTVYLYGDGKPSPNVWLDREREAPYVFEPGMGQVILPKRNRMVFIRPDCFRMITYVNEYAGDNVRIDFSGHFRGRAEVTAASRERALGVVRI
jgi:hypothetical protein